MVKSRKFGVTIALVCLVSAFISGVYVWKSKGIPFVARRAPWSIGIYVGESPFAFSAENVQNPVLTAEDVKDVRADFVADPFMVYENQHWYMFFEVLNAQTGQGDIGLASSKDGFRWTYRQIVLDEPFHLSYPYVFKWKGEYYMIPESYRAKSIRLYKAINFPTKWLLVKTLLEGANYKDSSIFRFNNIWWLFTSTRNDNLKLCYANKLEGPWIEHPNNPIIDGDANIARSAGRVLVLGDQIIRYAQDDDPYYGNQVRAFHVTRLTVTNYEEEEVDESPILIPNGSVWDIGMHHIDPHQIGKKKWIACVDGKSKDLIFYFLNRRKNQNGRKTKGL